MHCLTFDFDKFIRQLTPIYKKNMFIDIDDDYVSLYNVMQRKVN